MEKVKVNDLNSIPEIVKREFRFVQGGKEYVLEYVPLTAEQVEEIRASVPAPVAPLKPLKGFTAKEIAFRKAQGLPIVGPDTDDPEYVAADKQYQRNVSLEMVRVALGWDVPRDEFARILRTRLTQGAYARLISEVSASTFQVDGNLVENFLENLVRGTETDETSTTSIESSTSKEAPTAG